jgi:hypothetical protein
MHCSIIAILRRKSELTGVCLCLISTFLSSACSRRVEVKEIVQPEYPIVEQSNGVAGAVEVLIQVGVDGRVISVSEAPDESGANPELLGAAKNNAKQWLWGPFPANFEFPWYHRVRYNYKLRGQRTHFPYRPLIIKTHLPDEIEIIAIPCDKTYLELEMVPSSNEKN